MIENEGDSTSTHSSDYEEEWLEEYEHFRKTDKSKDLSINTSQEDTNDIQKEWESYFNDAKAAQKDLEDMIQELATKKNRNAIWTEEATLINLEEYKKKKKSSNLKSLWLEISKSLQKHGYQYNKDQVKRRYNLLYDKYKMAKDHNNQTGNDPVTSSYYDFFEEMYSKQPNITPIFACSSIHPTQMENLDEKENEK